MSRLRHGPHDRSWRFSAVQHAGPKAAVLNGGGGWEPAFRSVAHDGREDCALPVGYLMPFPPTAGAPGSSLIFVEHGSGRTSVNIHALSDGLEMVMVDKMNIDEMISSTGDFETKKFLRSSELSVNPSPRFFEVDVSDDFRYALRWLNAPKSQFQPQPQSLLAERTPLSSCSDYTFQYHGDVKLMPDIMREGQVFVVSNGLKSVIQAVDPSGGEFRKAKVSNVEGWDCYAFLAKRSLWAVDAALNDIVIDKTGLGSVPFPQVFCSRKFLFNRDISSDVHLFADLGSPTMYWSRELLDQCRNSGIKSLFAWAGYSDSKTAYLLE